MDNPLDSLTAWRDDPDVCFALDKISDGADPLASIVEATVSLAERARNAEDYMLIHRLGEQR